MEPEETILSEVQNKAWRRAQNGRERNQEMTDIMSSALYFTRRAMGNHFGVWSFKQEVTI